MEFGHVNIATFHSASRILRLGPASEPKTSQAVPDMLEGLTDRSKCEPADQSSYVKLAAEPV